MLAAPFQAPSKVPKVQRDFTNLCKGPAYSLPARQPFDPAVFLQVGSLTSLFPIAYGFSKFVSGVLGARTSPRVMLAGGLMATAAVNIAFGAGNSLPWFLTFWAINGILQVRLFFLGANVMSTLGIIFKVKGKGLECLIVASLPPPLSASPLR